MSVDLALHMAKGMPVKEDKLLHYLISANVVYSQGVPIDDTDPNSPTNIQQVGTRNVNCMVTTKRPIFGVAQIAQAQMGVGQQFDSKMDGVDYTIIDITILNMMFLGEMTKEEFHQTPEAKAGVI